MKILFITRKFPPAVGGMENLSYNLTKNIKCDKDIVSLNKISQLNLIWFFPYSLVRGLLGIGKYDVIHIGDPVLCFLGWVIKLINKKQKIAINLHGLDLTFNNVIYQKYISYFLKCFDSYICISQSTLNIAISKGVDKSKCTIIPVGVNDRFSKSISKIKARQYLLNKYKLDSNATILLTTGRLVERKGVYWFMCNVFPKLVNLNFVYFIVGTGPDENKLINYVKSNNLSKRVFVTGRISDDELTNIYKGSDLFIMPNITVENDVEGFGIVAIEAALSGLIVIASKVQGISEAIIHNKNGILVNEKDIKTYLKLIKHYSKTNLNSLSKSFSKYTKYHYSWKNICDRYIKNFKNIL